MGLLCWGTTQYLCNADTTCDLHWWGSQVIHTIGTNVPLFGHFWLTATIGVLYLFLSNAFLTDGCDRCNIVPLFVQYISDWRLRWGYYCISFWPIHFWPTAAIGVLLYLFLAKMFLTATIGVLLYLFLANTFWLMGLVNHCNQPLHPPLYRVIQYFSRGIPRLPILLVGFSFFFFFCLKSKFSGWKRCKAPPQPSCQPFWPTSVSTIAPTMALTIVSIVVSSTVS